MAEFHDEGNKKKKGGGGGASLLEKGEGMEALLGSVTTYALNTQSMFVVPFVILHIMLFPQET